MIDRSYPPFLLSSIHPFIPNRFVLFPSLICGELRDISVSVSVSISVSVSAYANHLALHCLSLLYTYHIPSILPLFSYVEAALPYPTFPYLTFASARNCVQRSFVCLVLRGGAHYVDVGFYLALRCAALCCVVLTSSHLHLPRTAAAAAAAEFMHRI